MNFIFPTPIKIIDVPNKVSIQNEISSIFSNISFKKISDLDHGDVEISNGTLEENIIELVSLTNLKNDVIKYGNSYCEELNILTEVPLHITKSWFFKTGYQGHGAKHTHRCLVAGVYYFKVDGNNGCLRFHNIQNDNLIHMFNGSYVDLTPKEGNLILFPGWLPHEITMNNTMNDRISIGFHLDV
ncbi:hypothetical protein EBU95_17340 [bacterium]|nr:hypothetical protein [bacterium]